MRELTSTGVRRSHKGPVRPLRTATAVLVVVCAAAFSADHAARGDGGCDGTWQLEPGLPGVGVGQEVSALAAFDDGSGEALYLGGNFAVAGNIRSRGLARWNGQTWSSIGEVNSNGYIRALAVWNDRLVAAGLFGSIGGVSAHSIAVWDGSHWEALGDGVNSTIHALTVFNGDLYATGTFTSAGGVAALRIARWDGVAWSALGSGLADPAGAVGYALYTFGSDVVVGGRFAQAGGASASCVARWDGAAWHAYGDGLPQESTVFSLGSVDPDGAGPQPLRLLAGGAFAATLPPRELVMWDGVAWVDFDGGGDSGVYALMTTGSQLLVGGRFAEVGATKLQARGVARWSAGTGWEPLGSGFNPIEGGWEVHALATFGGQLVAGGVFGNDGNSAMLGVARWDGTRWAALSAGIGGTSTPIVNAIVPYGVGVVGGGNFHAAGSPTPASGVAYLGPSGWEPLGVGLGDPARTTVLALAVHDGDVYASYDTFDAGWRHRISRCHEGVWEMVVDINPDHDILTLCSHNGSLYAGGTFTSIGGVGASRIARWDGSVWTAVGGSMNGTVRTLLSVDGNLIAGGGFTYAGGQPANRVARWDGATWHALGDGVPAYVYCLAEADGLLYAGGTGVRVWNGTTWARIGDVDFGTIYAIAEQGGGLYAAGDFTQVGPTAANRIARWDGNAWNALGNGFTLSLTGASVIARALAVVGDDVYAGGSFLMAGVRVSSYLARWRCDSATVIQPGGPPPDPDPDAVSTLRFYAPLRPGGQTAFALDLPEPASVRLSLFDVRGRRLAVLHDAPLAAGHHSFALGDGLARRAASGVYFGRAEIDLNGRLLVRTARLLVIR